MADRVWVTGASGFIGKHLAEYLRECEYEVHVTSRAECDLSSAEDVRKAYAKIRPQVLVHLAASARPGRDWSGVEEQFQNTVLPAVNLAREAPLDVLKFGMFFGSCEEYGNGTPPFLESQVPVCFSPYGWGKIAAHNAVHAITSQRGLRMAWIRPFLTFGPGQTSEQFVPAVIRQCLQGKSVALTPGHQTRDFIYVKDLCAMIERILECPDPAVGKTFNLASGVPRQLKEVGTLIQQIVGKGELRFGALPYRESEAMSFYASTTLYESLYGKPVLTPLEVALKETIEAERAAQKS